MIDNGNIYRLANMLLGEYGPEASKGAERLVNLMLADPDDPDGQLLWLRISRAIIRINNPDCAAVSPRSCKHRANHDGASPRHDTNAEHEFDAPVASAEDRFEAVENLRPLRAWPRHK